MRARPIATVSAIVLVTALLAGCTAGSKTSTADEIAPIDLCAAAAPSGSVSDAVTVDGSVGSPASISVAAPLTISTTERTVVVEGEGEPVGSASLVDYAVTVFDAATGARVRSQGYDGAPIVPVAATTVGPLLGCASVGSRIVVAVPDTDQEPASVWVLDVLAAQPARADGEDQEPVDGMPTVVLGDNGAPRITVPGGAPPTETEVAVLKKGDGAVVAATDYVTVHFAGVRWSDGEPFDSSWSTQAPTGIVPTDLIPGYRQAIEGQTLGSQVLVVIPPPFAYGEGEINQDDLTGETLVFVVDVLDTVPAA